MAARAQYGKQRQALPSTDGSIDSKITTNTAQNAQISIKTPIVQQNHRFLIKIKQFRSKIREEKQPDESP